MTDFRPLNEIFPDSPIHIREANCDGYKFKEFVINGEVVATLEPRPPHCDRGHWWVKCFLPGIDAADCFPRYYMAEPIARLETLSFLEWRIWKRRAG